MSTSGCKGRAEYLVDTIDVNRSSWDSLQVGVTFSRQRLFGEREPVQAPELRLRVFDSNIDTLYAGNDLAFTIADATLNDRELILVEACATFGTTDVCAQQGLESSPKRVVVEDTFDYPKNGDYDSGTYEFKLVAERQIFESTEWEKIDLPPNRFGKMIIRVDGGVGQGMQVPYRSLKGKFQLENVPNNADFRRDLLKGLLEENEAVVRFDVYSDAFALRDPILSRELVVDSKSLETREVEAGLFVEETARRLVGQLRTFPLGPQRFAYLDSWSFDREEKVYTIEMSFGWRSSFIRSRYFDIGGTITVNEDGNDGSFTVTSGNERGLRRWDQQYGNRTVTMDPLPVQAGSSRRAPRTLE